MIDYKIMFCHWKLISKKNIIFIFVVVYAVCVLFFADFLINSLKSKLLSYQKLDKKFARTLKKYFFVP